MDWEAYDYRPKRPKEPQPWLKWQVPKEQCLGYITNIFMFIIFVPGLLGFAITPKGIALQVLVIDYFMWIRYKMTLND